MKRARGYEFRECDHNYFRNELFGQQKESQYRLTQLH